MKYLIAVLLILLLPTSVFAGDAGAGVAVNLETEVIPGDPGNSGGSSYIGSSGGTFIWPSPDPIWATPKVVGDPKGYTPVYTPEIVSSTSTPTITLPPSVNEVEGSSVWEDYRLWVLLAAVVAFFLIVFSWWRKRTN